MSIVKAPPDKSHVYFFRPVADEVDRRDMPLLSIADHPAATLRHKTYTMVVLPPGKHRIALKGAQGDSPNWDQTVELALQPATTYYVAIFHLLNPPTGSAAARFELFKRDVAEFSLVGLDLVPANAVWR